MFFRNSKEIKLSPIFELLDAQQRSKTRFVYHQQHQNQKILVFRWKMLQIC